MDSGRDCVDTGRDGIDSGRDTVCSGRDTVFLGCDSVDSGRDTSAGAQVAAHSSLNSVIKAITDGLQVLPINTAGVPGSSERAPPRRVIIGP